MISDYSQNHVDTLHMKNLLHLAEDRFLMVLLLKHFPMRETQFVRDIHAFTVAPDEKILLSQRRRWIESTVHNLGELMFLDQLCGLCPFSMRFIVMMDSAHYRGLCECLVLHGRKGRRGSLATPIYYSASASCPIIGITLDRRCQYERTDRGK
jgi:hypothetical protein